jgi:two-component system, sensor histidine kinase and response regulator
MSASSAGDVLVVDDNPVNVRRLVEVLKGAGIAVRAATSGAQAIDAIRAQPPDVLLLDIEMPDIDGFDVCTSLAGDPSTRAIRIVFVSAHDEVLERARAFRAGGVDYMTKPFADAEVVARVKTHLEVVRLTREVAALKAELERG